MIISSIIRALLEDNSVNISELGTFTIKKLSSQVKEDIVYPPQNIIEFRYSKEVEGFDFVSKLSKWEQIRIDEAQTQVSEWINLVIQGLEHNNSLFFDNFGTFSKEFSGKIEFQSMIIPQLNIENEGFEPVFLLSQKRDQKSQNIKDAVVDKRDILLAKKKRKRDKIWFVLTIFTTFCILFALFFKEKIVQFYKTTFVMNERAWVSEEDKTDVSENNNDTVKILSKIESGKEINPDLSSPPLYLSYQKGKYYVIAGSFTKEEDALRHIKEKKLEKYHAKIIVEPKNPRKRVCIGVFDNEIDAAKFAAQIDKNYWVLK